MGIPDLRAHAHDLLRANRYLTLGTTGTDGRPWTSPVYFAADGVREFYWMSEIGARHSRNLVDRPQVSLVVFDSTVEPYHGRAVYASGSARELSGDELAAGLAVYAGADAPGVPTTTRDDVTGSSPYRLYQATAADVWVLCPREPRQPCPLHGLARDHRARID
ncbi:MAG TPA: pyridoxamine 5'-phosphate oxidase family protein [Nocardioidaceae bacterium]|jgi:nitroimidazol reductase NimA-like FMN-containing flavoprotein (pyridoxamine 5'-phosphate oxidase superfamily)